MGLILKNNNQKIELAVKGYECPLTGKSYWDNNWLVLSCQSTENGISRYGEFACFITTELQYLKMLLEQFQSGTLPSVSWNGTEPNFVINLDQDYLLTIYFYAENDYWEITFHKYATTEDIENLIDFCSDSLRRYPFRNSSPLQKQNIEKSKSPEHYS